MAGASGLAVEAREVWIHARPSGADHSGQERRHQPALVGQHLALTVHEDDPHVNPLGVKGVGEIGIVGTVGAIGNAIWHATGTRVRHFPIGIEDLLAG